ncbi:hypothetical protein E7T06_05160 [Deinococcus sp. Arct2-2]|uniref:hypothetical protein n=1 Tax=Deinococcus sp. Arct2-2 TaxID=2568653 RepID=UPI0010A3C6D7|nr:hypothetical protein [Deinococcus sp. Arct2-2]THF70946.1 hypothetical protein E7T06_05160 [Deinococcus sp. Arct2-2]
MQAFGQNVLARLWQADAVSVEVSSHTSPDPDALVFMVRQPETVSRLARAGTASKQALNNDGEAAALDGLDYLLTRVRMETLLTCPVTRKAPILAVRDAEGLRVVREGDRLPF